MASHQVKDIDEGHSGISDDSPPRPSQEQEVKSEELAIASTTNVVCMQLLMLHDTNMM